MSGFEKVGVLGLGTMGAGIAQLAAQAGYAVTVLETDQERVDVGMQRMADFLQGGVERGKLTAQDRGDTLARVRGVTDVAELAGADLVIEAVTERVEVKQELLARVSGVLDPAAVLATNTSALSVTELANSVSEPERFAGLHFFNPAPVMKVVEVVRALRTSAATLERLSGFVTAIGKEPVEVKDRPGFLVNWLLIPYLNDVIQAYDEELATAEDIDLAVKLGLGHKLGPLELLDLIGLDVHDHVSDHAYQATSDRQFASPPLLKQMVVGGMYGNKNGAGFRSGGRDD